MALDFQQFKFSKLLIALGLFAHVCSAQTIHGQIYPKFVVVGITYQPPSGTAGGSQIDYRQLAGSSLGFSVDLGPGLQGGYKVNAATTGPAPAGYVQYANSGSSISLLSTSTSGGIGYTTNEASQPGYHDYDFIKVWLNVVFNFEITPGSNTITWTGYSFQDPGSNQGPTPVVAYYAVTNLKQGLIRTMSDTARSWDTSDRNGNAPALNAADATAMLAADPFVSVPDSSNVNRLDLLLASVPFTPGANTQGTLTYQAVSAAGAKSALSYPVGLGYTADTAAGVSILKNAFPENFTLTMVPDQNTSDYVGQKVPFAIVGPTAAENSPIAGNYNLYRDNIFNTVAFAVQPPANRFVPVTPCRLVDTRNPAGALGGPIISGGVARDFNLPSGACGLPANATAYSLNFTVVPSYNLGYLTAWPTGGSQPSTSILNSDGRTKASAAIIPAGTNGSVTVYGSEDTHLVIDVDGYFVSSVNAPANSLAFDAVTPCRILDTRLSGGAFGSSETRTIPVLAKNCGIPSTAQAYSLNYTAIPPTGLGYLSTWPTGQTKPLVSTLNAKSGIITANAAIVPAGTNGSIQVFTTDVTDLVIDINGYFSPNGSLALHIIPPCRWSDSRFGNAAALSGDSTANALQSTCLIAESSANALVLNATVVPQSNGLGFLSLWPAGTPWPTVSTLNAFDAAVTSNLAIVPTTAGAIAIKAAGTTQAIFDITGYFAP